MIRYTGRTSAKAVERNFPHMVEMAVPPGGLGRRLDAMRGWHKMRGIQSHQSRGRYTEGTSYIRWCFADEVTAEAFLVAFGGDRFTATKPTGRSR